MFGYTVLVYHAHSSSQFYLRVFRFGGPVAYSVHCLDVAFGIVKTDRTTYSLANLSPTWNV